MFGEELTDATATLLVNLRNATAEALVGASPFVAEVVAVAFVTAGILLVSLAVSLLQLARLGLFVSLFWETLEAAFQVSISLSETLSETLRKSAFDMKQGNQQPLKLQNQFSVLMASPSKSQTSEDEPVAANGVPCEFAEDSTVGRIDGEDGLQKVDDDEGKNDDNCIDDLSILSATMGSRGPGLTGTNEILRPNEKLDLEDIVGLYGEDYNNFLNANAPSLHTADQMSFLRMSDADIEVKLRQARSESLEEKGAKTLCDECVRLKKDTCPHVTHEAERKNAMLRHYAPAADDVVERKYLTMMGHESDDDDVGDIEKFKFSGSDHSSSRYDDGDDEDGWLSSMPTHQQFSSYDEELDGGENDENESPKVVVAIKRREAVHGISQVLEEALDELEERTKQVRRQLGFLSPLIVI